MVKALYRTLEGRPLPIVPPPIKLIHIIEQLGQITKINGIFLANACIEYSSELLIFKLVKSDNVI
jgi:hypothetical protein